MAPRTSVRTLEPVERSNACTADVDARNRQADAAFEQAKAWHRVADALDAFKPAADTVHSMGARLDALCSWLGGKWPWIFGFGGMVLYQVVQAAPVEGPKIAAGVGALLKAMFL